MQLMVESVSWMANLNIADAYLAHLDSLYNYWQTQKYNHFQQIAKKYMSEQLKGIICGKYKKYRQANKSQNVKNSVGVWE